jgi:surfactin synthase thioesterase subunit
LALRLKRKAGPKTPKGNLWFPGVEQTKDARLRLFTFPYAGGGVAIMRSWSDALPEGIALCPSRLPGRESRLSEAPIETPEKLVEGIAKALKPHLDVPFAFLGYCMGAFLSFELTRWLRRHSLPQPKCLLVAGSRAPQFRLGHVPHADPTDEELVEEFRQLEYAAREELDNEDLLQLMLPSLRADSKIGRIYTYFEEPPLDVPIRAYGGEKDPRLPADVIDAWRKQTTSSFRMRLFPGKHFFMHTVEKEFQDVVAADLEELA